MGPYRRGSPTRGTPAQPASPSIEAPSPYAGPQLYTPISHAGGSHPQQQQQGSGSPGLLPVPPQRARNNKRDSSTSTLSVESGSDSTFLPPNASSSDSSNLYSDEAGTNPYLDAEPTDLYGVYASHNLSRARGTVIQRRVQLSRQGIFSIEHPVSQKYLSLCSETTGREFTHLRYTAATVQPDLFPAPEVGYELRPRLFQRQTELFVVITMYNEDEILFARSMAAIQKNIAYLCSEKCPRSWGPTGWTNVVVCIVADGRQKINPRVLEMLSVMGVYADGLSRSFVNGKPVTSHIYEFTTQISINENMETRTHQQGVIPCQVMLCIKERNAKKINSHRWFFNGFGPIINPNVCVLLDVGTKPSGKSIFSLWREFDSNARLGGACGEIKAELGKNGKNLINPLVAAQNFEYKISNILDKPLESMFGYISVLPGAFSAYRYAALQNSSLNTGPLASYFKGEDANDGSHETDVFNANMYLAEDRILCFEVVTKRNEKWILKYVKDATASTDVPDGLPELVSQRRRWLNGSFFAAMYSVTNFWMFFRSSHSIFRKLLFMIQTVYNLVNLILSWFQIGNMYLTFYLLFQAVNSKDDPFNGAGHDIFLVLNILYGMAIIVQVILAFGNRPQATRGLYYLIFLINVINMGFLMYLTIRIIYNSIPKNESEWVSINHTLTHSDNFRDVCISLVSTYGLYLIGSLLYLDPWHMVTSLLQYLLTTPVYINMFMVFSFCNLHDISWGTKGDNTRTVVTRDTKAKKTKVGGNVELEVELPSDDPVELDANFVKSYKALMVKVKEAEPVSDRATVVEDYFRTYRTRVVLLWLICNVALAYIFSQQFITRHIYGTSDGTVSVYLRAIFWVVAGLAVVRFLGCISYLATWAMTKSMRGMTRKRNFVPKTRPSTSQNTLSRIFI